LLTDQYEPDTTGTQDDEEREDPNRDV